MEEIFIHVSDPPFRPQDGDVIENKHFRVYGSTYGRFIFSYSPTIMEINDSHVSIRNCRFTSREAL